MPKYMGLNQYSFLAAWAMKYLQFAMHCQVTFNVLGRQEQTWRQWEYKAHGGVQKGSGRSRLEKTATGNTP